jgi:transcription elongation factor GreA
MDENHSTYLTAEGIKKLQEELDYLLNVRRPEVARLIAEAKADGDVSENAGYDEAKNTQAFVEGRILTLKTCWQMSFSSVKTVPRIQSSSEAL